MLIDNNGVTATYLHEVPHTGMRIIETAQDVGPTFEDCLRLRNLNRKHEKQIGFRHVARIPLVVMQLWLAENPDILKEKDGLSKKLQQREWSYLKSSDETVYRRPPRNRHLATADVVSERLQAARSQVVQETNGMTAKAGLIPVGL